jgi:DNA topoisomerase-3
MRLFIAEKKIQALAIADALSDQQTTNEHYILCGDDRTEVVTWANGHLYSLAEPHEYDPRFKRWTANDLPIIPATWKKLPTSGARAQIDAINRLLTRADTVVHACDFDREGQAIGDEILQEAPARKAGSKTLRLILRGLSKAEIVTALGDLRSNADFFDLGQSAVARARADWAVGINMTRIYTIHAERAGYTRVFNIGRVMTPTLSLVVKRDREIESFVPSAFYQTVALIHHDNGDFAVAWKPAEDVQPVDEKGRVLSRDVAEGIVKRAKGRTGRVTLSSSDSVTEKVPLPHNLTTLQISANVKFGITAMDVSAAAQSLYEKYKLISYPRPNCRYLPEDQHAAALSVLRAIARNDVSKSHLAANANTALKAIAWDTSKVVSHHGIIPLAVVQDLSALTEDERRIYDLVCRSYIALFYDAAEYVSTTIECEVVGERFEAKQRELVSPGWKMLYPSKNEQDVERLRFPAVAVGDRVACVDMDVVDKRTSPPDRYTDATLIAAMEKIEKFIEDEDFRRAVAGAGGIGTDATRAQHVDGLIQNKFVVRRNRQLVSTSFARDLIDAVPGEMTSPSLTAGYEQMLGRIAEGKLTVAAFWEVIVEALKQMVAGAAVAPRQNSTDDDDSDETGTRNRKAPKGKRSSKAGGRAA